MEITNKLIDLLQARWLGSEVEKAIKIIEVALFNHNSLFDLIPVIEEINHYTSWGYGYHTDAINTSDFINYLATHYAKAMVQDKDEPFMEVVHKIIFFNRVGVLGVDSVKALTRIADRAKEVSPGKFRLLILASELCPYKGAMVGFTMLHYKLEEDFKLLTSAVEDAVDDGSVWRSDNGKSYSWTK